MTEQKWLACTDPQPMLDFLRGKASDRKLRLFACACCRRIWHLLSDERSRTAVEVLEAFCEGAVTEKQLEEARSKAHQASYQPPEAIAEPVFWAAAYVADAPAFFVARQVVSCVSDAEMQTELREPRTEHLVHDVFGNPFRPIALDSAWLTPTVTSLAQAIYNDRAFDRLPILADALEDSGCTNADILNHCRQPGVHVRGCWAVDLVLGKE